MSKIYDGGPACPRTTFVTEENDHIGTDGKSLRDSFAEHALVGLCAHNGSYGPTSGPGELAGGAYEIADAMIAVRKEGEG